MLFKLKYFFLLFFIILGIQQVLPYDKNKLNQFKKINHVLDILDKHYLDSVDLSFLTKKAIIAILKELDPHSKYVNKKHLERNNERMKGSFGGVGIRFRILRDTLYVVSVIPNGPSAKAGIKQGDRIIKVEEKNIASVGLNNSKVLKLLKGTIGTEVKVTVKRKSEKNFLPFTITRGKIPIKSVNAYYMVDDEIGYIRINQFTAPTKMEFNAALDTLLNKGMQKLILDLQGNPGGFLRSSFTTASQFLGKDKLVVYVKGVHHNKVEYKTKRMGKFEEGDLIILVNESSASASEIVAGAVQDWDRGIIAGRRTYGKGLVQRQFKLNDGSAIKITTSRYYTPSGRNIQKPFNISDKEYYSDIKTRHKSGELASVDSIDIPEDEKYYTLKENRIVYGGGGIIPDIFIPVDTSKKYTYYNKLRRKDILYPFMLDYLDNHKEKMLIKYPNFDSYNEKFELSDSIYSEIFLLAEGKGFKFNEDNVEETKKQIFKYLKANIAGILWSTTEFYQVTNASAKEFQAALKLLQKELEYQEAFK